MRRITQRRRFREDLKCRALSPFDPTDSNFILLQDFRIPGGVSVYELQNHRIVDGRKDFLRLNVYLTKNHNYVTVWRGLLDLLLTEAEFESGRMASVKLPDDFDFRSYNEDLFRGHIDSAETAKHIFKALRIGGDHACSMPQALGTGPDRKLRCDLIGDAG
jgi:hypothetical protein